MSEALEKEFITLRPQLDQVVGDCIGHFLNVTINRYDKMEPLVSYTYDSRIYNRPIHDLAMETAMIFELSKIYDNGRYYEETKKKYDAIIAQIEDSFFAKELIALLKKGLHARMGCHHLNCLLYLPVRFSVKFNIRTSTVYKDQMIARGIENFCSVYSVYKLETFEQDFKFYFKHFTPFLKEEHYFSRLEIMDPDLFESFDETEVFEKIIEPRWAVFTKRRNIEKNLIKEIEKGNTKDRVIIFNVFEENFVDDPKFKRNFFKQAKPSFYIFDPDNYFELAEEVRKDLEMYIYAVENTLKNFMIPFTEKVIEWNDEPYPRIKNHEYQSLNRAICRHHHLFSRRFLNDQEFIQYFVK